VSSSVAAMTLAFSPVSFPLPVEGIAPHPARVVAAIIAVNNSVPSRFNFISFSPLFDINYCFQLTFNSSGNSFHKMLLH
jgi:hypothetical protein